MAKETQITVKKQNFIKIIFSIWLVLWILFLVREDKDDQYRDIKFFYTNDYEAKEDFLLGKDLHAFLVFSKKQIPPGATYELTGFKRFSIFQVRSRYFLWPLKSSSDDPDYRIAYGGSDIEVPGYKVHQRFGTTGVILKRGI